MEAPDNRAPPSPTYRIVAGAFWITVTAVYFWRLGAGSLEFWDEALTAERSRELLVTGDWLTPHTNQIRDFNKPPIYYWLTAASFVVLGQNEFTVRLWSVLFGLGCLAFVSRLAARASGSRWGGLLAAVILATNPHWINGTRQGMPDSGLLLGMLSAIYALLYGPTARRRVVVSALCLTFGGLVKNPLALFAAMVPFIEFAFVRKQASRVREVFDAVGLAIVLVLAWYVLQIIRWGPVVLDQFVGYNIIRRITEPIEGQNAGPFYYLETWWGGATASLFLFVVPLVYFMVRQRNVVRDYAAFWMFAALMLVLITISASKRGSYLLLVYPFIAISTGGFWRHILAGLRNTPNILVAASLIVAVSAACLAGRYKPIIDGCPLFKEAALRIKAAAGPQDIVVCVGVPGDAAMFYTGHFANTVWAEDIGHDIRRFTRERRRDHYLIARRAEASAVIHALEKRKRRWSDPRVFFQNGGYAVVLLPARRDTNTMP
jgi:4-amino-4-deoxy-L-arabinose transferase-like glycosyltransferase